jgi:hypothetical protein
MALFFGAIALITVLAATLPAKPAVNDWIMVPAASGHTAGHVSSTSRARAYCSEKPERSAGKLMASALIFPFLMASKNSG